MIRRLLYAGLLPLLFAPTVALAAAPRTFQELVNSIVTIINGAVAVLVVLGLVIFLWGISTSIHEAKDKGGEKLRAWIMWGILILFVMVSIWGILELLKASFLGDAIQGSSGGTQLDNSSSFTAPTFSE